MDWTRGYRRTYEYVEVDKFTFDERGVLDTVSAASIDDDVTQETLETASITLDQPIGETYIRIYMVCEQDCTENRVPLATVFAQTPRLQYDGPRGQRTVDCYSTLYPAKMKLAAIGQHCAAGKDVLAYVHDILAGVCHAPIVKPAESIPLSYDFVAQDSDTVLSLASSLLQAVGYHLEVDAFGTISFAPDLDAAGMSPKLTLSDDERSIVKADIQDETNWADVPNVCQVTVSAGDSTYVGTARNDDANDPLSTVSRNMEVTYRESASNVPTSIDASSAQAYADAQAKKLLDSKKSATRTVTLHCGYCPIRLNDCIQVYISRTGLRATVKVTKRSVNCDTECEMTVTGTMVDGRKTI